MARHSARGRGSPPPISAFSPARSLSRSNESTPGTYRGFCKVCGAPVLGEIRGTLAQRTDRTPRRGALRRRAGYARRRPRPPPRRARVYRRQGAVVHGHRRSASIPGAYPRPERSSQFLTSRSHAIAVRAATRSVCWSFGEGTFAGKHGNGRDAPLADRRPTRTHASKAPHFSAAARSTADCERLPDMRRAICRCSNRSR